MEIIRLKNGMVIPRLGMGTWQLGENTKTRKKEMVAIQSGIESGISLIDTAEMYGNGDSEKLIGSVIKSENRKDLFIVSKVYPHNAGNPLIFNSIDKTLKNLQTDYLDLYLLHWRGSVPLDETVDCMEELVKIGKIRSWGVSNFDVEDMEKLIQVPKGENCVVNQVLYHLGSRGIEYDLLPWLENNNIVTMAYCPLAQAGEL